MQERVIKIILPEEFKDPAQELLETDKSIFYWLEESNSTNVVISMLVDSGQTENLMDNFERRFGHTENFKLIVLRHFSDYYSSIALGSNLTPGLIVLER